MSTRDKASVSEAEAGVEAEKVLRFKIGSIPHLGDPEYKDGKYIYPVLIRLPRVIFDEDMENPVEVKYLSEEEVGAIEIDAETGDLADRTPVYTINRRIREKKREVDEAVQKALVKAEAEQFSLLPFPEHRYTPIQDLLAEVILRGQIPPERFEEIGGGAWDKYEEYVEALEDVELLRWEEDRITAADPLIEIEARTGQPSEALNAALAQFFRAGVDNFDMIQSILGPYLTIAGYYYRRSLEMDSMPKISTRELREEIRRKYSGRNGRLKAFKLSRYLLQLETIGILHSESDRMGRSWVGEQSVLSDLLEQEDQLQPIAGMLR